jgi:hypothetical protein
MQHAPPEYPDPLPFKVEEGMRLAPPRIRLAREITKPWTRQIEQARSKGVGSLLARKNQGRFRLRTIQKLGEETPFRQELVGFTRVGFKRVVTADSRPAESRIQRSPLDNRKKPPATL